MAILSRFLAKIVSFGADLRTKQVFKQSMSVPFFDLISWRRTSQQHNRAGAGVELPSPKVSELIGVDAATECRCFFPAIKLVCQVVYQHAMFSMSTCLICVVSPDVTLGK